LGSFWAYLQTELNLPTTTKLVYVCDVASEQTDARILKAHSHSHSMSGGSI
jgi:hypothetical protein